MSSSIQVSSKSYKSLKSDRISFEVFHHFLVIEVFHNDIWNRLTRTLSEKCFLISFWNEIFLSHF